jgi:archaellum component FlaF (FlaF/FlaG flagellin family)
MKKAQIKFFLLAVAALCISLAANISSSKAGVKASKLTIVNKTNSQIDAIYIAESDDILPQPEEILMPKETITIDFDKYSNANDKKYQVKLVFVDGKQSLTEEIIFDGDSTWVIK